MRKHPEQDLQMNSTLIFFLAGLACSTVQADEMVLSSGGGFLVRSAHGQSGSESRPNMKTRQAKPDTHETARETALATAIASAAKKDFIEGGIEASRNMLIECQKEASVVLVTPSLRSNSQRDHCFRF